jgi:hypothetical protein
VEYPQKLDNGAGDIGRKMLSLQNRVESELGIMGSASAIQLASDENYKPAPSQNKRLKL